MNLFPNMYASMLKEVNGYPVGAIHELPLQRPKRLISTHLHVEKELVVTEAQPALFD